MSIRGKQGSSFGELVGNSRGQPVMGGVEYLQGHTVIDASDGLKIFKFFAADKRPIAETAGCGPRSISEH